MTEVLKTPKCGMEQLFTFQKNLLSTFLGSEMP